MVKYRIGILFLFVLPDFILNAQVRPSKLSSNLESNYFGTIVFEDDSEMSCNFSYNPSVSEGLLFVKTDSTSNAYGVTTVKSFSFFDDGMEIRRYFYALPVKERERGVLRKYFIELIHTANKISILGRNTVMVKVYRNRYNAFGATADARSKAFYKDYTTYLLDHRDNTLYTLSKSEILRMIDDKKTEVLDFIKQKRLRLEAKKIEDYIAIVDYYSAL